MVTKYIENDKDANEFVRFLEAKGGKVLKIYALRQGYQFDIIRPSDSDDTAWGHKELQKFLSGQTT